MSSIRYYRLAIFLLSMISKRICQIWQWWLLWWRWCQSWGKLECLNIMNFYTAVYRRPRHYFFLFLTFTTSFLYSLLLLLLLLLEKSRNNCNTVGVLTFSSTSFTLSPQLECHQSRNMGNCYSCWSTDMLVQVWELRTKTVWELILFSVSPSHFERYDVMPYNSQKFNSRNCWIDYLIVDKFIHPSKQRSLVTILFHYDSSALLDQYLPKSIKQDFFSFPFCYGIQTIGARPICCPGG